MSELSEELINNAEEILGSVYCNPKDYYSLLTHEHKLRNDKFEPFECAKLKGLNKCLSVPDLDDEGKIEMNDMDGFVCETCGRKEAEPSIAAKKVVKDSNKSEDEDSNQSEDEKKLPAYVY